MALPTVGLVISCCLVPLALHGQIRVNDPKQTAERSVEGRVNNKIDQGINRGLDKVEEGIGNIFKKKDKKNDKKSKKADDAYGNEEDSANETSNTTASGKVGSSATGAGPGNNTGAGSAPLKSYSKFDFVPGEKVLYYDDFERVAVGDFPVDFNTNSSGEVMTIEGKTGKWLGMTKNGSFIPEAIKSLPDNYTLEFEVGFLGENGCANDGFGLKFYTKQDNEMDYYFADGSYVTIHPGGCPTTSIMVRKEANALLENKTDLKAWKGEENPFAKVSIWRQGTRIRVYINQEKVWDLPRFFPEKTPYQFSFYHNFYGDVALLITNLRVASAPADTRSKLLTEGKLVTRGILFDVNKATIKPESYGTLKEIATVLKENPAVRVKIIGHTDSDGDDASNLTLSKKRAESVKTSLASEFGIDASRMETDGKGESQPSEPNTTALGKANNRRVEFIKL